MKKIFIFFLFSISILSFFTCKSGHQTPEEFVENLIQVLAKNDFEEFKDFLLTKSEIRKSLEAIGKDASVKAVNDKWKSANENTEALFKRFYKRKTNWSEVIVDSLQYDIQELNNLKATEVMIFYSVDNKKCQVRLRRLSKIGNAGWKLANYPSFFSCVNK